MESQDDDPVPKEVHPCLISVGEEEAAKLPGLTDEQIEEALRKGWEERQAWQRILLSKKPGNI